MPAFKDDIFSVTFGITLETASAFSRLPVIELIMIWPDDTPSCNFVVIVTRPLAGLGLQLVILLLESEILVLATVPFDSISIF